ncbi:hypothetical protein LTR37_019120 [Vermiconidia calcicola]|uniref:Uncharacterized protein n=1 Tax=Vermiconidia calcicola TaxID=1690605 RepID=A0ACC3MEY7_9PEZI|nr:hypothetical protein LTR37_019120 [Vermiconidia calcicola]
MQTLWSRVAQVRGSCRCPHCISPTNGVSRRATASATRRTPKYLTSSTLWYSGIFAAAATFDAGVKKQRKEQWDRAIADVKQELGQPATAGSERRTALYEEAQTKTEDGFDQYKPLEDAWEGEDVFRNTDPERQRSQWPANTGPPLRLYHLSPDSLYAAEEVKKRAAQTRWTAKKLATVQASTDVLLFRMFLDLRQRGVSAEAAEAVPDDYAKYLLQGYDMLSGELRARIEKLSIIKRFEDPALSNVKLPNQHTNICNFSQDDSGSFRSIARNLNFSLQSLFNQERTGQLSAPALLAKLSYNLAFSSAPPNLDTYNTLLLGLSRINEHTLVQGVISSMHASHVRLNEVSMAAILDHYTAADQSRNFVRQLERMRGKHGGPALARAGIRINEASGGRLIRKPDQPEKVIQLPYPTPYVFKSVMAGVIKFAGFENALSICRGMSREGWGLCMAGLTPLLRDCAERSDWTHGQAIWTEILALKSKSRRKKGSMWESERIGLDTYASMLRLCSRCKRKDVFDQIWIQATGTHSGHIERLARLVKGRPIADGVSKEPMKQSGGRPNHEAVSEFTNHQSLSDCERTHEAGSSSMDKLGEQRLQVQPENCPVRASPSKACEVISALRSKEVSAEGLESRPSVLPTTVTAPTSVSKRPAVQSPHMPEEQLLGNLPSNHELDDYELGERPMAMYGG